MKTSTSPFGTGATFGPDREVATVLEGQPHVVILGAGASRQTCLHGDANGHILPLMKDLIDVVDLAPILDEYEIRLDDEDFEAIYSRLAGQAQFDECRKALESKVHEYFSALRLPSHPTLYDHLVLSLRPRDVIATFNWDPLLVQAARRNARHADLPQFLFLHGNVAVGYCDDDKCNGPDPGRCPKCKKEYAPTRLLYPVRDKNYDSPFLRDEWHDLQDAMRQACLLAIFGYGAPETDGKAVSLFKNAWPDPKEQMAEWVELIDIESRDRLSERWDSFILSHHYDVTGEFYESRIARHPRRTSEAWAATHLYAKCEAGNLLPRDADFPDLWAWFARLKAVEDRSKQ